jgi:hypothetical protein
MDKKETIQKMVTQLKIIYDIITKKEVKKDYKYKKDDWEEILKGNDYY